MVATSQHGKLSCCFFRLQGNLEPTKRVLHFLTTVQPRGVGVITYFHLCLGIHFFSKRVDQPQLTRRDRVVTWSKPAGSCVPKWFANHWKMQYHLQKVVCIKAWLEHGPENFTYQPSRGSIYGVPQTGKLFSLSIFWHAEVDIPICSLICYAVVCARLLLPVNGWHKASDRNVWQRRRRAPVPWPDVFFAKVDLRIWDLGFRHIDFSTSYMQVNL